MAILRQSTFQVSPTPKPSIDLPVPQSSFLALLHCFMMTTATGRERGTWLDFAQVNAGR